MLKVRNADNRNLIASKASSRLRSGLHFFGHRLDACILCESLIRETSSGVIEIELEAAGHFIFGVWLSQFSAGFGAEGKFRISKFGLNRQSRHR